MRLHFCESCGQQFTSEGDLPKGAALCESCREKKGTAPPPRPGRTNTLLRASNARSGNRLRSGSHPSPPTHGKAGLSPHIVWGGIIALAMMIGLLLFVFHRMNVADRKAREEARPERIDTPVHAIQPEPVPDGKPDTKAGEQAFEQLLLALEKLPPEDRAGRLSRLEDFVKRYPESNPASRARTMISTLQSKSDKKSN
jgi:hypothetical protein